VYVCMHACMYVCTILYMRERESEIGTVYVMGAQGLALACLACIAFFS